MIGGLFRIKSCWENSTVGKVHEKVLVSRLSAGWTLPHHYLTLHLCLYLAIAADPRGVYNLQHPTPRGLAIS